MGPSWDLSPRIPIVTSLTRMSWHYKRRCEAPHCGTAFYLGGRHHCRLCGNSVCSTHFERPLCTACVTSTAEQPEISRVGLSNNLASNNLATQRVSRLSSLVLHSHAASQVAELMPWHFLEVSERPDGSASLGSAPPEATVPSAVLSVTPSLTVSTETLPTVSLNQRIASLVKADDGLDMMRLRMSGDSAPSHSSSSMALVDDGGMMQHEPEEELLRDGHSHGFITAAISAFANHYPLAIRPQHFWLMILQAIATHVDLHAEEVRAKWVAHDGKKELLVQRDEFVLGKANDWQGVVAGKGDSFLTQIGANVVDGVMTDLVPEFSGTTTDEAIAGAMTVMDICKNYFSYKCCTSCGFPSVVLEGSLEDWRMLRVNAESLISRRCEPKFAATWCNALLPLLDKFVEQYQIRQGWVTGADAKFWNSMVKRGGTSGSGARTWFSGWINVFFPYIERRHNRWAIPYSPSNGYVKEGRDGGHYGMDCPEGCDGPDVADFPKGLAEAPVTWAYHGNEIKLKFKAGFIGATQDKNTKIVRPRVGWFIVR